MAVGDSENHYLGSRKWTEKEEWGLGQQVGSWPSLMVLGLHGASKLSVI